MASSASLVDLKATTVPVLLPTIPPPAHCKDLDDSYSVKNDGLSDSSTKRSISLNSDTSTLALPPVDRGWKAWTFIASSFALEVFIWGSYYSYGVFQAYYTTHPPFDSSRTAAAAIGPMGLAIMYIEGLVLYALQRRYPDYVQWIMRIGLIFYVLTLLISSFITSIWLLVLLQGFCLGIAGGMTYWPSLTFLHEWFVEKRGLAGGLMLAGGGVGGLGFPLLLEALLSRVGLQWTFRILACLMALFGGVAILGIRPRIPVETLKTGQRRQSFFPEKVQFHKQPLYWCFSIAYALQGVSYQPVSSYLEMFTTSLSSPVSAAAALSILNSASIFGQVLFGHLGDRLPYTRLMLVSTIGCSLVAFLLWGFASKLVMVYAFAVIFGALGGGFPVLIFPAAEDAVGKDKEHAPIAVAAIAAIKGVAVVSGPIISSVLLKIGKSSVFNSPTGYGRFGFGPVILFVGSCAALTALSVLAVAAARSRPSTRSQPKSLETETESDSKC